MAALRLNLLGIAAVFVAGGAVPLDTVGSGGSAEKAGSSAYALLNRIKLGFLVTVIFLLKILLVPLLMFIQLVEIALRLSLLFTLSGPRRQSLSSPDVVSSAYPPRAAENFPSS